MESGRIQNLRTDYNYSTVPTKILNDNKLSATAKGILAFLLSLPSNHNIHKKDLTKYFKEGYYALNKAFEELVTHRIVHKIELRDKKGHFRGYEYVVHETPKKRSSDARKVITNVKNRKSDNRDISDIINHVFNEDCLLTMRRMPDNFVDLVLTSPPYDHLRSYNGNNKFEFEKIAVELTRITKNGGVIVWIVGDGMYKGSETGTSFKQALFFKEYCGLRLHDTMIFEKNTTTYPAKPDGIRYTQCFEYMYVFSKGGKPKTVNLIADKENRWKGTTNFGQKTDRDEFDILVPVKKFKPIPEYSPRTNIWRYVTGNGYSTEDKFAHLHPAIFPEQLASDHILTWTNEGDIVYDNFAGSGTVLKMAKQLNRKYIGSEIVKEYFDLIVKRLSICPYSKSTL